MFKKNLNATPGVWFADVILSFSGVAFVFEEKIQYTIIVSVIDLCLITIRAYSLEHKERYNIVTVLVKISTFTFYNRSVGTFYRVILFRTCMYVYISHYVFKIVVS